MIVLIWIYRCLMVKIICSFCNWYYYYLFLFSANQEFNQLLRIPGIKTITQNIYKKKNVIICFFFFYPGVEWRFQGAQRRTSWWHFIWPLKGSEVNLLMTSTFLLDDEMDPKEVPSPDYDRLYFDYVILKLSAMVL